MKKLSRSRFHVITIAAVDALDAWHQFTAATDELTRRLKAAGAKGDIDGWVNDYVSESPDFHFDQLLEKVGLSRPDTTAPRAVRTPRRLRNGDTGNA